MYKNITYIYNLLYMIFKHTILIKFLKMPSLVCLPCSVILH